MKVRSRTVALVAAAGIASAVSGGTWGAVAAHVVGPQRVAGQGTAASVDCPTEDSCRIDYRDGHWIITPIVP
jgi:hypothetical protein